MTYCYPMALPVKSRIETSFLQLHDCFHTASPKSDITFKVLNSIEVLLDEEGMQSKAELKNMNGSSLHEISSPAIWWNRYAIHCYSICKPHVVSNRLLPQKTFSVTSHGGHQLKGILCGISTDSRNI